MKLLYNFLKDMRLSARGFYFYIEIGFALVIVAVLLYVVPENFNHSMSIYAYLNVEDTYQAVIEEKLSETEDEINLMSNLEEVKEALKKNRSSVGVAIYQENEKVIYEFILQGYENDKMINILKTSVKTAFASEVPGYNDITTVTILDENTEKLSDRLNMLPLVLSLNAAFMGLFIIASYIFLDKKEGTIRALIVTPSKMWHYLLSKVGVIMVSGLISGFITLIPIAGGKAHYFHFFWLLVATNLFGSALGLFVASFFDSMEKAMGWLYMGIIILAFASISYYMPAFSPLIIRVLPTYPMIFAYREILLTSPDLTFVYLNTGGFLVGAVILFLISNYRFKKTLTI